MSKMWLGALVVGGVIYVTLKERILRRFEMKGGRAVPLWLARLVLDGLTCYSSFMGVREVSVGGELNCDRSKKYMIVWHPHGFITWVPFFLAGKYALDAQPAGERWFPVVAPVLFRIPIFGEVLAILGGRRVERKVVEKLLARGDSIAIQPGGVKEQAKTSEVQEQAFFPARLGFIRLAIRYGVDLLPVYFFGENQLYKRVDGLEWLSNLINKTTGMTLPIVTARFGIPMAGPIPIPTDIHTRWGRAVPVGPREEEPSDEHVEEVFCRYVTELRRLFREHAKDCLPPEIANRGLKIVRLDGRPLPPEVNGPKS
ncbi:unnamed protein product [Effrenium voratum]|uniref:Acyltransferase n=1 Tax=Effrenium voratum TaxID=2562239 RepID=A0AA36N5X5_9DINO|nr:unnamed protein product [Effrenium voratum]CAJ1426799.1 unnamed protein product [Effrenium voratum]